MFYLVSIASLQSSYSQSWTKQYDHMDDCVCGLSLVGKGDKHGYADKDGKLIVPLI